MMERILFAAGNGTLVLALAWILTACLRRRSADLRHRIWLAALACTALLLIPLRLPETAQMAVTYTLVVEAVAAPPESVPFGTILSWIYSAGAVLLGLRWMRNFVDLVRITARARRTERAGVRISGAIATPMTWGVLRPVILLPEYSAEWDEPARVYAVEHERLHIERADWLWQSCAQLIRAIFLFHPLVWLAEARLRAEAEHAVDDAMLVSGAEPAGYAEQLLAVAKRMSTSAPGGAVAMVRRSALAERVSSILDLSRVRTRTGAPARIAIAMVAVSAVPFLGAFQVRTVDPVPSAVVAVPQPVVAPTPVAPVAPPAKRILLAQAPAQPKAPAPAPEAPKEPYRIGGGVSAPVAVYTPEPKMTAEAEEAKAAGEVWLTVVIDEKGIPTNIQVVKSLGYGLDEEAVRTLEQWRFKPGMKEGVPVPVRATIAVHFKAL